MDHSVTALLFYAKFAKEINHTKNAEIKMNVTENQLSSTD